MKIVLFQPQIPQNTGTIARTCSVTGSDLILVRPLGFSTDSRHLKRAGLDYWNGVSVQEIDDLSAYLEQTPFPFFFFSSKASRCYTDASFSPESLLIFGSETTGLPKIFWGKWPERFYRIPIKKSARCLNLACSVSIALFEAFRQLKFVNLSNDAKSGPKEERGPG
jgi:tRNA (cytidine/uridine-2'-O-)-methyltransferase